MDAMLFPEREHQLNIKEKRSEVAEEDSNLQPHGSRALFCITASLLNDLCPHVGNFLSVSDL